MFYFYITACNVIYSIGDVHGCYDLFERLVAEIRGDNDARAPASVRVILLGDLIDRGPNSARLVERCMALSQANADFIVLRGNHEQTMLDALGGNLVALEFWLKFGGDNTLRAWHVPEVLLTGVDLLGLLDAARERVPASVLAWLRGLPLSHRIGNYLFVHAGIRPGRPLALQSAGDMMWVRDGFLDSDADHGVMVVHGHSVRASAPEVLANRIGIDAGAYRTGRLIALGLERDERWTLSVKTARTRADRPAAWPMQAQPAEIGPR